MVDELPLWIDRPVEQPGVAFAPIHDSLIGLPLRHQQHLPDLVSVRQESYAFLEVLLVDQDLAEFHFESFKVFVRKCVVKRPFGYPFDLTLHFVRFIFDVSVVQIEESFGTESVRLSNQIGPSFGEYLREAVEVALHVYSADLFVGLLLKLFQQRLSVFEYLVVVPFDFFLQLHDVGLIACERQLRVRYCVVLGDRWLVSIDLVPADFAEALLKGCLLVLLFAILRLHYLGMVDVVAVAGVHQF